MSDKNFVVLEHILLTNKKLQSMLKLFLSADLDFHWKF